MQIERVDHRLGPPGEGYRDPEQGGALLHQLAKGQPDAHIVRLGWSVQERPIDALVIGQPPEAGAPALRVLATHHGDEWSSFEVALALAEALVQGSDPRAERVRAEATTWVVPYVNPDGVVAGSRHNANFVDLNRNYDYQWSADEALSGDRPFSEPETRAVRALGQHVRPMSSLSLHSGARNLGWVWN